MQGKAKYMSDFFISFSSHDAERAEWIAVTLEIAGYSVVFQPWDFRPGSNFVLEMDRGIREAERVLAVLSPSYLKSSYARVEWAEAVRRDPEGRERRLIPVRVEKCDASGLLGPIVYIDLVGLQEEAARRKLLAGIEVGRAKPFAGPASPSGEINVSSRSFGIVRHDENGNAVSMNFILVDEPLPKSVNFHILTQSDAQSDILLELTMCRSSAFQVPHEECLSVGECILPFAPPLPKGSPIDIEVTLGVDGLLSISAKEPQSGRQVSAAFKVEAVADSRIGR